MMQKVSVAKIIQLSAPRNNTRQYVDAVYVLEDLDGRRFTGTAGIHRVGFSYDEVSTVYAGVGVVRYAIIDDVPDIMICRLDGVAIFPSSLVEGGNFAAHYLFPDILMEARDEDGGHYFLTDDYAKLVALEGFFGITVREQGDADALSVVGAMRALGGDTAAGHVGANAGGFYRPSNFRNFNLTGRFAARDVHRRMRA